MSKRHLTEGYQQLPLAKVYPSDTNPRKTFDEDKLAELADSVRDKGVLQPILVRPWPAGREVPLGGAENPVEPAWEIVAGERRWRAACLAELAQIPAIVRDLSDQEVAEIQVIENLQRQDLDPIEEAEGYQRLIEQHGYTAPVLAAKLSKSEAYVYGTLKLANLPDRAREAIRQGRISKNHGVLIGRIPNDRLREQATARILDPKELAYSGRDELRGMALTFRDAKRVVEAEFMVELKGACFDRKSLTLVPSAGACTTCPKLVGNNRAEYPDGRGDVCTDPACFKQKETAHRKAQAEKAEAKGFTVLHWKEAKKHFSSWGVKYDSPYQDLAEHCPTDADGRTYRQLVGEELKAETVVAFDDKGRAHHLAPKEKVRAVLETKGTSGTAATCGLWATGATPEPTAGRTASALARCRSSTCCASAACR